MIFTPELDCDPHQVEAEHAHPAGRIALLEVGAVRKHRAAIEHADVVEAKETALENVVIFGVLPIYPPGESEQHFVENGFQERAIAFAVLFALNLENAPGRPRQHRRIDVAEVPFVSGDLSIWVLIPFAHDELELLLGETGIDQGKRDAM